MRLTVGRKIFFGFGIVLLVVITVVAVMYSGTKSTSETMAAGVEKNIHANRVSNLLQDLEYLWKNVYESRSLIQDWAKVPTPPDHPDKKKLIKIKEKIVPLGIKPKLSEEFVAPISKELSDTIQEILVKVDDLFLQYDEIQNLLPDLASYDWDENITFAGFLVGPGSILQTTANDILARLDGLIDEQKQLNEIDRNEMNSSFEKASKSSNFLLRLLIYLLIGLIVAVLLIAWFTTRSITKPVGQLKRMLIKLGQGIIPSKAQDPSNDEIGDMSVAMNNLVDGLEHTTEFARHVGQSNFDYDYQPLSHDDTLGHALLKMRDDLAENERILEQKVIERTEEVVRQKGELEKQKHRIEELYKDVTDSIKYAKRLQDSILPPEQIRKRLLPHSFVLFKPKDIVSGDFYWMEETDQKIHVAAVDCTGHGVPGAFMSLVGANALNSAVKGEGKDDPASILEELNRLTSETLNKEAHTNTIRDGMDLAMVSFTKDWKKMEYAGANNPLYLIRNGELIQTKADKFAIGSFEPGQKTYSNHTVDIQKGDTIYIFSDGYADQFGGIKGKKFMYRQFRETLLSIKDLPLEEQGSILNEKIERWRGNYEQIDDILVIGVRI